MKRFFCQCHNEIFFDNLHCNHCHVSLGFEPNSGQLLALIPTENSWQVAQNGVLVRYKTCSRRETVVACNWLVAEHDPNQQCQSCRLTRIIPNLSYPANTARWIRLEATKRHVLSQCYNLQLPIIGREHDVQSGLVFDFLEDKRSNPDLALDFVYSGHHQGVITLNAAEADDSFSVLIREQMQERYRTLLGHFRHEMGHYYWMVAIEKTAYLEPFRRLFGDERADYQQALTQYYDQRLAGSWQNQYISQYASAHPLEDWAESWTHYLHLTDTLETAAVFGLVQMPDIFAQKIDAWVKFAISFNALNRSMGIVDPYPFEISPIVREKLYFIDDWVKSRQTVCPTAANLKMPV